MHLLEVVVCLLVGAVGLYVNVKMRVDTLSRARSGANRRQPPENQHMRADKTKSDPTKGTTSPALLAPLRKTVAIEGQRRSGHRDNVHRIAGAQYPVATPCKRGLMSNVLPGTFVRSSA